MNIRIFQRDPQVRLRRETWGGIAFDRGAGDLLELDASAFALLTALSSPQTLTSLRTILRRQEYEARLPETVTLLRTLEGHGLLRQVSPQAPPVPPIAGDDELTPNAEGELRAPLVAHWAVTYRCNLHCPFCYSESSPLREAGPGREVRLQLVERLAAWGGAGGSHWGRGADHLA